MSVRRRWLSSRWASRFLVLLGVEAAAAWAADAPTARPETRAAEAGSAVPARAPGSAPATTGKVAPRPPLPPLPDAPKRTLPAPTDEQRRILDELLKRLLDSDPTNRRVALGEVANVDESLLPAIQARLDGEASKADRARMKRLLLDIRKEARDTIEKRMRAAGDKGEVETPDYLEMVVTHPETTAEAWPSLVNVLALSRMCVHLKTVESVRVLITVYVRFDFLRIDTQLQLDQLGDHALAGLIEATRHQAPKVAAWARRQLDAMGRGIPGEAVQVSDPTILADVLLAYGHTKDPDAARVVLSFTNSERAQIRLAARRAVVLLGEVGGWQLRDFHENLLGERPPREWPWDRTARELFGGLDQMRLEEVYTHHEAGLQALRNDDLETATKEFDRVLLLDAQFGPNDTMIQAYLDFADRNLFQPADSVDRSLLVAMRLGGEDSLRKRAESLLLTRQAKHHADRHLADRSLLDRALELDPENQRARELAQDLSKEPVSERASSMRILWPSLLVAAALAGVALILLRRRRSTA